MQPWAQAVIVLCIVVVTIALVPTLIALRRAAERGEHVLGIAEQELRPVAADLRRLMDEARAFSQEGREEVARVAALTDRAEDLAGGVARVVSALAGLSRAGQLVGVVAGVKTGLDVFLHRFRKQEGDHHE
jgi:hypothetical protein